MIAHVHKVSRKARRQRQHAEARLVRRMAHRRAIMALATVHGWDSRFEDALRTASQRIHWNIARLREAS